MYRRQQFDRVDPRKVLPSRHTLFIRGLDGSTDVACVKEFFSDETNSKCSVDFFSMTEDRKRLGVAIRFRTNEMAREMLSKYNNKNVLGAPVEITWFKDLKKARAKMFEEQRQAGGRQFQRGGYHNNVRSSTGDRGLISTSPGNNYNDRKARAGSSSSGGPGGYRATNRQRYSLSRSRSFTGSSSRSNSNSGRSKSRSASRNRRVPQNSNENFRDEGRGFIQGQQLDNRQFSGRNQSRRSRSGSSSSTRSTSLSQARHGANNMAPRSQRFTSSRGAASPSNFGRVARRDDEIHGSPTDKSRSFTAFSNAPAPEIDGGSSLVSGLIQLKRRNPQTTVQTDQSSERYTSNTGVRRRQRSIHSSSSSGMSREGFRNDRLSAGDHITSGLATAGSVRGATAKRLRSLSPPFNGPPQQQQRGFTKSGFELEEDRTLSGFNTTKKAKRVSSSPDSRSPSSMRKSYARDLSPVHGVAAGRRGRSPDFDQLHASGNRTSGRKPGRTVGMVAESEDDIENRRSLHNNRSPQPAVNGTPNRWRHVDENDASNEVKRKLNLKSSVNRDQRSSAKLAVNINRESSLSDCASNDDISNDSRRHHRTRRMPKEIDVKTDTIDIKNSPKEVVIDVQPADAIEIIRQRKESLAQDYKRDCEAFTTVVRTLISKDADLEARLMPMLKEILHERGQRCIEELRTFIAEHKLESATEIGESTAGTKETKKGDGTETLQEIIPSATFPPSAATASLKS